MSLHVADLDVTIEGSRILTGVRLDLGPSETVALLGPSGSGKTTLLRAVAGLIPIDSGSITWDGSDLTHVATHERRIGMVFQDYALFPHLTVGRNVAFGLEIRGLDTTDAVEEALRRVGLNGLANRTIEGLSGGEQQRVALARALVTGPRLMLLDEPLGALDAALRGHLLAELRRLLASLPAIYVTHDQAEAMAIADRIALMRQGTITRVDTPERIWSDPRDVWTARFIGHENVFEDSYVPSSSIREHSSGTHEASVVERRFNRGTWNTTYRMPTGRVLHASVADPQQGPTVRVDLQERPLQP